MAPKADWEKYEKKADSKEKEINPLDMEDIQILKTYAHTQASSSQLKTVEGDIKEIQKRVNEKMGVKESDTGLAPPNLWDIPADKQRMSEEHPLQVARCTKIIRMDPDKAAKAATANPLGPVQGQKGADERDQHVINIKQIAKYVVGLGERVIPTDVEEGMRVGIYSEGNNTKVFAQTTSYSYWHSIPLGRVITPPPAEDVSRFTNLATELFADFQGRPPEVHFNTLSSGSRVSTRSHVAFEYTPFQ